MSRKFVLNLDYALIQGFYWMFYVVAGIFVSVYMLGKGYSNTAIGIVIAVGNIMSVLLQAVMADITDRTLIYLFSHLTGKEPAFLIKILCRSHRRPLERSKWLWYKK